MAGACVVGVFPHLRSAKRPHLRGGRVCHSKSTPGGAVPVVVPGGPFLGSDHDESFTFDLNYLWI